MCVICWQSDQLTHFTHASKQFNPWPAEQLTYITNSSIDTRGIARAWQQRHSPSPTVGARHFMQLPACLQEEPLPAEQHLCSCTDMLSTQDASCMVSVPEGIGSCSVAKPWQDKLVAGWSAAQPQLLLFKSSDSHMYCSWVLIHNCLNLTEQVGLAAPATAPPLHAACRTMLIKGSTAVWQPSRLFNYLSLLIWACYFHCACSA